MKNRFCTVFLYMFAIDGVLGLFSGGSTLLGSDISHGTLFQIFGGIFSFAILVCAIVQIIIGFAKKLRWSARIIGLYVIFYNIVGFGIGIAYGVFMVAKGVSLNELQSLILNSPLNNGLALGVGLLQILLFIWAFKDLSGGHYLSQEKPLNKEVE